MSYVYSFFLSMSLENLSYCRYATNFKRKWCSNLWPNYFTPHSWSWDILKRAWTNSVEDISWNLQVYIYIYIYIRNWYLNLWLHYSTAYRETPRNPWTYCGRLPLGCVVASIRLKFSTHFKVKTYFFYC